MKKILVLLSVFIISGCSLQNNSSDLTYVKEDINDIITNKSKYTNTSGIGFKYYKPRDFSLLEDKDFNHVLLNNGNKYYLNIDINAYNSKFKSEYQIDPLLYYSDTISNGDIFGYIEVRKGKNSYFYLKMLYNYSCIEVSVKENELNSAINSSMIILSSMRYNNNVIASFISNKNTAGKENTYEIKKPNNKKDNRNILDVYEYDSYTE